MRFSEHFLSSACSAPRTSRRQLTMPALTQVRRLCGEALQILFSQSDRNTCRSRDIRSGSHAVRISSGCSLRMRRMGKELWSPSTACWDTRPRSHTSQLGLPCLVLLAPPQDSSAEPRDVPSAPFLACLTWIPSVHQETVQTLEDIILSCNTAALRQGLGATLQKDSGHLVCIPHTAHEPWRDLGHQCKDTTASRLRCRRTGEACPLAEKAEAGALSEGEQGSDG